VSLAILRKKGMLSPPVETEDGLTAEDIMDKVRSFYLRLEKNTHSEIADYAESYFLELMLNYPKSMCNRHMTETLKQLIALFYIDSKPEAEEEEPAWNGFSYEDLAIVFDRSKASIHEAIRQKEGEVKQFREESKLRAKVKAIALEELIKEEKMKLLEKKYKGVEKTTEQTPKR